MSSGRLPACPPGDRWNLVVHGALAGAAVLMVGLSLGSLARFSAGLEGVARSLESPSAPEARVGRKSSATRTNLVLPDEPAPRPPEKKSRPMPI